MSDTGHRIVGTLESCCYPRSADSVHTMQLHTYGKGILREHPYGCDKHWAVGLLEKSDCSTHSVQIRRIQTVLYFRTEAAFAMRWSMKKRRLTRRVEELQFRH